jgi:hypothetical protein
MVITAARTMAVTEVMVTRNTRLMTVTGTEAAIGTRADQTNLRLVQETVPIVALMRLVAQFAD